MLPLSFLVFWWSIILFLCELFKVLRLILYFCFFTFIYFSFPCAVLKVKDCIFYCTIWIICVHNCMLLLFSVSWFIQGRCTCTLCLRTLQCALVEFVWTHNPIFFCIKKKPIIFLCKNIRAQKSELSLQDCLAIFHIYTMLSVLGEWIFSHVITR